MRNIKIFMVMLLTLSLVACGGNDPSIELKKDNFVIEFGEEYSLNADEYIKADKEILKDTVIKVENENSRECPDDAECDDYRIIDVYQVGKYDATATYKDEELKFTIEIKDTTPPEFEDFVDKIEIELNSTDDLNIKFEATDLSEVTIVVDMEKVDTTKTGEYKTTVTAKDTYKNETVKDITIVVKEKETEAKDTNQNNETVTGNTSNESNGDSTSGTTGGSTNTGGASNTGSTGGTTTPQPSSELCPGGHTPSLSCDTIILDGREGQNNTLYATEAEVRAIEKQWKNFEIFTNWQGFKVVSIMYNNWTKKYTYVLYDPI